MDRPSQSPSLLRADAPLGTAALRDAEQADPRAAARRRPAPRRPSTTGGDLGAAAVDAVMAEAASSAEGTMFAPRASVHERRDCGPAKMNASTPAVAGDDATPARLLAALAEQMAGLQKRQDQLWQLLESR